MVKDSFTGEEVSPHRGVHLLKNDGTVEYYSSSKSFKNALKLKRDKRKLKWTEAYRQARVQAQNQVVYKANEAVAIKENAAKAAEKEAVKLKKTAVKVAEKRVA